PNHRRKHRLILLDAPRLHLPSQVFDPGMIHGTTTWGGLERLLSAVAGDDAVGGDFEVVAPDTAECPGFAGRSRPELVRRFVAGETTVSVCEECEGPWRNALEGRHG